MAELIVDIMDVLKTTVIARRSKGLIDEKHFLYRMQKRVDAGEAPEGRVAKIDWITSAIKIEESFNNKNILRS